MITQKTIQRLESYSHSPYPILSIYLGADTLQAPTREFLATQFHSLLHKHLSKNKRAHFASDIMRIENFLKDFTPTARSLVIFSADEALWEVVTFEFSMPPILVQGDSAHLSPIYKALKRYIEYLVILVDREKARVFTVEQGEITDYADYKGIFVPQRMQATGRDESISDTDAKARHNEVLLRRHIDAVIRKITHFAKKHSVHFLIIGGHAEMFKKVAEALPINLQDKVAGHFITEIDIPLSELLQESKKIVATIK